ncbi:SMI1/KNR4 family protein [Pontibacter populi]|uniref:SMI1/KNR4 family protein n=1 Tax=Pontibacter populi TaxID=890055 RepID=A0ABV1RYW3_9BACT
MNQEELSEIEESLGISLPRYYKDFQIQYPDELKAANFNEVYFSEDPKYLVEINQFWKSMGLPSQFFAIGNDIGGNYFFINLSNNKEIVYYFDHEEAGEEETESNSCESGKTEWGKVLNPEHQNLMEFKDWLLNFWGDASF